MATDTATPPLDLRHREALPASEDQQLQHGNKLRGRSHHTPTQAISAARSPVVASGSRHENESSWLVTDADEFDALLIGLTLQVLLIYD